MSRVVLAVAIALTVLVTALAVAMVALSQPAQAAQKHNAYWPYSVETVIRDR